jgi:CDP-glucose 4,6-dehydratase
VDEMNVLVTGGTGFIGSHLCNALDTENKVVILVRDIHRDTAWESWLTEALKKTTLVLGDLLNINTVRRTLADYEINTVYHLAAQAIVATAQRDPASTFQINVQGTVNLLEACRQLDIPSIYIQSTDKVYGNRMNAQESDPLVSTGIYETSKVLQDFTAQSYAETYGLNIIIGRACNVYGFDMAKRIIPNTIRSCIRGEPPIIYEAEETLRQYIYATDLTRAIHHLIGTRKNGIFNIGTEVLLTQEEVVRRICRYFPLTPRLVKREKPLKEISRQSLNWTRLKETGWIPEYTFEDGIEETIHKFEQYGM